MTGDEMRNLKPGDRVRHVDDGDEWVVSQKIFGSDYVVLVQTAVMIAPSQWERIEPKEEPGT